MWKKFLVMMTLLIMGNTTVFAYGDTIAVNAETTLHYPEWATMMTNYGGTLLLSDSPETVEQNGVLYQDTVSGMVRLFFHHVNGTNQPKKLAVILQNSSDQTISVTLHKTGVAGPDVNYALVGKTAQQRYFNSASIQVIEVPAKGAALLDASLERNPLRKNELINGIYDFMSDNPVTVKVVALPADANSLTEGLLLPVVPADQYKLRGTFANCDRLFIPNRVYDSDQDHNAMIILADGVRDEYLSGVDKTDNSQVVNYGNYGVMYRIFMPMSGKQPVHYLLNPRGGGYAGSWMVKQGGSTNVFLTPADRLAIDNSTQAADLGQYNGDSSLWFTFMPPGASNLPVLLVWGPHNVGEKQRI